MTSENNVLRHFLLPLDDLESFRRTALLMGILSVTLGERVEKIALLHVLAGSYLSNHMANIDVRAGFFLESELFKRLKQQHISRNIEPKMKEAAESLIQAGVAGPIDLLIEDGDPVEHITAIAEKGYSTVVMERRGLSAIHEMFVGSVTSGILHRNIQASVYLTGKVSHTTLPAVRCLIAVDGSRHSRAAVAEAATLLSHCIHDIEEIALVHVRNIARYGAEMAAGLFRGEKGEKIMQESIELLTARKIPESKITRVSKYGDPAEVIEALVKEKSLSMIFMGRRGLNALNAIFLGSVSRKIIRRCPNQAVALVSGG